MARPISANEFQQEFARQLRLRGWEVELEVGQVYEDGHGSTKNGRIDVVARRKGRTIAVELDRGRPRKKSILKLSQYPCDAAYVVCRSGCKIQVIGDTCKEVKNIQ